SSPRTAAALMMFTSSSPTRDSPTSQRDPNLDRQTESRGLAFLRIALARIVLLFTCVVRPTRVHRERFPLCRRLKRGSSDLTSPRLKPFRAAPPVCDTNQRCRSDIDTRTAPLT